MKVKAKYTYQANGEIEVDLPDGTDSGEITEVVGRAATNETGAKPDEMLAFSWTSDDKRFGGRTY